MDLEHTDLLADALEVKHLGSLKSSFCNDDRHRLCNGSTGSVRRLHPMFSKAGSETPKGQMADQMFPCMCECHGPFEEYS